MIFTVNDYSIKQISDMEEIVDIPHNIVTSSAHAGGDNLPISVVSSDSGIFTDTFHYTFLVLFSAHSVLFRIICYNNVCW